MSPPTPPRSRHRSLAPSLPRSHAPSIPRSLPPPPQCGPSREGPIATAAACRQRRRSCSCGAVPAGRCTQPHPGPSKRLRVGRAGAPPAAAAAGGAPGPAPAPHPRSSESGHSRPAARSRPLPGSRVWAEPCRAGPAQIFTPGRQSEADNLKARHTMIAQFTSRAGRTSAGLGAGNSDRAGPKNPTRITGPARIAAIPRGRGSESQPVLRADPRAAPGSR